MTRLILFHSQAGEECPVHIRETRDGLEIRDQKDALLLAQWRHCDLIGHVDHPHRLGCRLDPGTWLHYADITQMPPHATPPAVVSAPPSAPLASSSLRSRLGWGLGGLVCSIVVAFTVLQGQKYAFQEPSPPCQNALLPVLRRLPFAEAGQAVPWAMLRAAPIETPEQFLALLLFAPPQMATAPLGAEEALFEVWEKQTPRFVAAGIAPERLGESCRLLEALVPGRGVCPADPITRHALWERLRAAWPPIHPFQRPVLDGPDGPEWRALKAACHLP